MSFYLQCFSPIALPLLIAVAGCGGEESTPDRPDAGAEDISCSDLPDLVIGQCIDGATGEPCVDFEASEKRFISIAEQPVIPPIIGFQGSPMFVMGLQGEGIDPGTQNAPAFISVQVLLGEQQIGGFNSSPELLPVDGSPNTLRANQLYVVAFGSEDLQGQELEAEVQITIEQVPTHCSRLRFTVGELIGEPFDPHA